MAIKSLNRFPRRGSRPNRQWTGSLESTFTTIAAGTKVLMGGFVLADPSPDETVLRTVGIISVMSDQAVTSEDQIGAWGIIPVTDRAFAAGVASMPGPGTDIADDGWFVFQTFAQHYEFIAAAATAMPNFAQTYMFDSKAKRRLHSGQTLAVVVENVHASHGLSIAANIRILTMLSGQ